MDLSLSLALNSYIGSSKFIDLLVVFGATYLPWILLVIVLVWLLKLAASLEKKWLLIKISLVSVLVARWVITEGIRFMYPRPRPYLESSQINALFTVPQWSFPSGHATLLFAFATSVFYFNKRLGIFLFIGSAFVLLARVMAGVHYVSDVVVGALIGFITAYTVAYLFTKK